MNRRKHLIRGRKCCLALAVSSCTLSPVSFAFEIDNGNSDLVARWDNTLKYSTAFRTENQSSGLLSDINQDDSNRNFDKGLSSNRFDWLSEFDVVYNRQYGFRLSGAAWYDQVYNDSNDNDSPSTVNNTSVIYNEFNKETKELHGRKAELLDAFIFGGFDIGESKLNLRAGKHSVLWGETLFYGMNGIAAAMAPVDVAKLVSVPGTQFKEVIRPVPQLSAQLQLDSNISLGLYYQLAWDANRLPAAGSYFAGLDFNPAGGENMYLGPFLTPRSGDIDASDSGQGGVQLRLSAFDTDFGFYAVRFHNKTPQQVTNLSWVSNHYVPSSYQMVYHEGIVAYGASASHTFDSIQASIEGSIRRNQDLASSGSVSFGSSNNDDNPAYAVGKTAHINISTLWTLPASPFAQEATLTGEIMWNRALSVDKSPQSVDPNSTRDAYALRVMLEPTYRQVIPGLDLTVPVGIGYSPKGSRSRVLGPALPPDGGGDLTFGINGTYLNTWKFSAAYTHYFGDEGTLLASPSYNISYDQYLKDRDFLALSLQRTF